MWSRFRSILSRRSSETNAMTDDTSQLVERERLASRRRRELARMKILSVPPGECHFDPEEVLWEYRYAEFIGDAQLCMYLRSLWESWRGADILPDDALLATVCPSKRASVLLQQRESGERDRDRVEAQLGWLSKHFGPWL
jgi:hypothetical protein